MHSTSDIFSFFSGLGFLDLGFEKQGFNIKFINEYHQAIQIIGKAREGGRMTDADARNYQKMLFATSSPEAFINSLNDLGSTQSGAYNRTYGLISRNYDLGDVYPATMDWQPLVLAGPIAETAVSGRAMNLPIPSAPRDVAGGVLSGIPIEQLVEALNNPATDDPTRDIVRAEINKRNAASGKKPTPKKATALNPFE